MKIEKFQEDFIKLFGEHLSLLYIPGISQRMKFTLILNYLVNLSASHDFLIRSVKITEVHLNEFEIKVNENITINYKIGQEVAV